MDPILIKNLSLPELEHWVESVGERRFRARQIFRHLYVRQISTWQECSDLSKAFRTQLEYGTRLEAIHLLEEQKAADGTIKYLFALADGNQIESVFIPDAPRFTLCVSSQVGCALGCKFCLTGSLGLKRNLETAEIVDQVMQVQKALGSAARLTHLVFMGMGEPLANYEAVVQALKILLDPNGLAFSHRRITVSTVGLVPQLLRLGQDSPVNLAISLHAPNDAIRDEIMPINRVYPLDKLMKACRTYPVAPRKRITFEYIMLDGINDSIQSARALIKLLHGTRAKVNLIPYNDHRGSGYRSSPESRILEFQEVLAKAQITVTIRQSRGAGIGAACGQLAACRSSVGSAGI